MLDEKLFEEHLIVILVKVIVITNGEKIVFLEGIELNPFQILDL